MELKNGLSSLFFIIPAVKSYYYSKIPLWKLMNFCIIVTSFLTNSTIHSNELFLFADYVVIYLMCNSYIKNAFFTNLLGLFHVSGLASFENIKDITFVVAGVKSFINEYLKKDGLVNFYTLIVCTVLEITIYIYRYQLFMYNHDLYVQRYFILTSLWHFFVSVTLYIASETAI